VECDVCNNRGHYLIKWSIFDFLQFSFEVGILKIFGNLEPRLREELKKNYWIVDNGYNSFPTKIPGTQYKKALLVSIITF
jgi:hypothetical protein